MSTPRPANEATPPAALSVDVPVSVAPTGELPASSVTVTASVALANRLGAFVNLPIASLDRLALKRQLDAIGTADAPSPAVTA